MSHIQVIYTTPKYFIVLKEDMMRFKVYYFLLAFIILSANLCFAQTTEISNQTGADNQTIQPAAQNDESLVSEQNITEKNTVEQPMSLTLLLNGYFPMNNPDEKTGFGGGFRYKYSFLKYFAFATSLEYTSIGLIENHYIDVKAHFLVQRNLPLNQSGFVPYAGIGPSFRTDVSSGTSVMGYSLTAGTQYVWKYLVTGFGIDYSSFPQFKDTNKNIYASDIKVFFEIGARF